MLEIDVSLGEFLTRALTASIRNRYLAFVSIIARSADGEFLQEELIRNWESFDDLTGSEILLLSPRLSDGMYPAGVSYQREPAGVVNWGLTFGSIPSSQWQGTFLTAGPQLYRPPNPFNPYARYGAVHSPRRPSSEADKKAAMTSSASETARFFGIPEKWLPCVLMLSISDKRALIVSVDRTFSLYALLRATLIEYEPTLRKLLNLRRQEGCLTEMQKHKERELRAVSKTLSSVENVLRSWNEQVESACTVLHALAKYDAVDDEQRCLTLAHWLKSDGNDYENIQKRLRDWTDIIRKGEDKGLPRYLIDRALRRVPRAIDKKLHGILSKWDAERERTSGAAECDLQNQILDLKSRQSETQKQINSLKNRSPFSKAVLSAMKPARVAFKRAAIELPNALSGWSAIQVILNPDSPRSHTPLYDVALSFSGDDRDVARSLAEGLQSAGLKVFFDEFEKERLWGTNLIDVLTSVYWTKTRFCMMIVSKSYVTKVWTDLERQAMQAGKLLSRIEGILPVRIDDSEVPGLLPTIGYLDYRVEGADGIVSTAVAKLRHTRQNPLSANIKTF